MSNLFQLSDQTWLYLDQIRTVTTLIASMIVILGFAGGFLNRRRIKAWLLRNQFPHVGENLTDNGYWDAMIFTVSRPQVPEWVMRTYEPRYVAFIASRQSTESAELLQTVAADMRRQVLAPYILQDPNDPKETREACSHLVSRLKRLGARRIAVDITGGKATMSIGAFMGAEETGVDTVYVSTRFDEDLKRPDPSSAKLIGISTQS